ncbi:MULTISPECIES: sugar ABC transporter ATP-binding protein [unclassified Mesorhizobium]|uniref:sugar ABC transporter ATP-binding protein n=1 Tax=unclassified Mesorhizobium TaxID=325217 RepID=UPI001CC94A92|nr:MULTISPECIES: sugar ABC transporter ATP-binding protein [unclassified Mesorhizobium]MBZ9680094.1 sugar ABC transporter ATP-binding protein [Mesorhizobium sp. CO1-1-2]MBZ9695520.1 sugar ABC transporter ATP-binding protein [Mesorhizobium sp. CO1-1-9]MBZ9928025.1 sugar ABC transporter ATP-binding protein [Mesorhizobium sp. BR1-1-4]
MSAAVRTQATRQPVLEMRHISKTFGAIRALQDVSLSVHAGELHALMGENGAGKSTLMKVLSGAYRPDPGGEILIDGAPAATGDPIKARAAGIAVIYQELSLAPNLTVAQNIFLGNEPRRFGIVDRDQCNRRAAEIVDRLGVSFSARALVSGLSLGERQLVEIARALSTNARIIVMDEPTTSLTSRETDRLFEVIATLKAQGIAIIYISHRMEEVYQLADRVSVLRDSGYVGTLERADLNASRLVSMMVGRDLSAFYKKDHRPPDGKRAIALSVRGMSDAHLLKNCSFDLHHGEVLALAGLVGSGRTELARLIFGADKRSAGTMELDGKPITIGSPREALDAGIAYLTEDRKELGLFLDMSISDNISMGVLVRDARAGGLRDFTAADRRAAKAIADLSIRTNSAQANAGSLSGGNQQKVLLARLLETEPKVVILDEPTRGVDVGAKSEIYRLIDNLANRGIAILMISSELPEVIGVADRVLVMRDGAISGEVTASEGEPLRQEAIMELATGASQR